ncbi:MAG: hypothetical protein QOD30_1252 [Actinomycetota bacterium]|nr:hypothetical protein [Actinomycetota bacterium]
MTHLSASKLTFSPKWADLDEDARLAEQVAALDIVSKYGGEIKAQYALFNDGCLFSVIDYPDETSALKSALAIERRGVFLISLQTAITLEDLLIWQDEAKTVAGR